MLGRKYLYWIDFKILSSPFFCTAMKWSNGGSRKVNKNEYHTKWSSSWIIESWIGIFQPNFLKREMAKKTVYYAFSSSRYSYFVNAIINNSIALGSLFLRYFKFQIQKCHFSIVFLWTYSKEILWYSYWSKLIGKILPQCPNLDGKHLLISSAVCE